MSGHHIFTAAAVALAAGFAAVAPASAAVIVQGTYQLHNHPDGEGDPPPYGARLDELYDVTGGHDSFTFDFDHPLSNMLLDYDGSSIRIYGVSYGGRDAGATYFADAYQGIYTFDFTYNLGVQLVPGDDDLMVEPPPSQYNYGTVLTPLGDLATLRDGHYDGGQLDFRFGDEDNDLGHRGFPGLSGWGWLFHALPGESFYPYVSYSDWIFTAELVPAPGTLVLLGAAGLIGTRRRR